MVDKQMIWIEVISLRTASKHGVELEAKLQSIIDEIKSAQTVKSVRVYSRVKLDTDYCIHLHHDSDEARTEGSTLGVYLTEALKDFGLVNHSIWKTMHA
jgi:hypothetical protein